MEDAGDRLLAALSAIDDLASDITADEAVAQIDAADLQVFWRDWPHASSWAGALWRKLNEDLEGPATAQGDSEFDEVGGPG